MTGEVEHSVRATISAGDRLRTPAQGATFVVDAVDGQGVVLLFGKKETPTRVSWAVLDDVAAFLRGRGWVKIGSVFDTQGEEGTLDGFLKRYMKRATAGWVAALLETAGVVDIDRDRPTRVRLRPSFGSGVS